MQDALCTALFTTIFFHDYSYEKYGLFSVLLSVKHVNFVTKVYVAFNDLNKLKVLLCECKINFKTGS